jgi:hypothetical protein
MNTKEIADHVVALFKENKFAEIGATYWSKDVVSTVERFFPHVG